MSPGPPLVSVVVTFYNLGPLVAETLDSVLSQKYPAVEVIAVDDGSTDDTAEKCRAFGDRITFVHQANAGMSAARNAGLRHAHGSLIAHLDGDDLWEPDKLTVQVDAARRFPEAGLILVDGIEFAADGLRPHPLIGPAAAPLLASGSELVTADSCHAQLLLENFVATPSQIMVPAHVFRRIGGWNERFRIAADYELYLRVALRYPWVLLSDKLVRWRYSPRGVSGDGFFRSFAWVAERPAILLDHLNDAPPALRAHILDLVDRGIHDTARAVYHAAHKHGERRWATRYLMALMRSAGRPARILPYLIGTWSPIDLSWPSRFMRDP